MGEWGFGEKVELVRGELSCPSRVGAAGAAISGWPSPRLPSQVSHAPQHQIPPLKNPDENLPTRSIPLIPKLRDSDMWLWRFGIVGIAAASYAKGPPGASRAHHKAGTVRDGLRDSLGEQGAAECTTQRDAATLDARTDLPSVAVWYVVQS